jgi:DNA-binding NarL/FixJ family response regulator
MEKREKILIIDDELDFVEAFRRTMEAWRFEVNTASSRTQAQDLMKSVPDIIILGTLSPAGQAFAMHQWLKQHPRYKEIPLMVIDAKENERNTRGWRKFEGMQLVSDDYISKPVEPATLVPRIKGLLEELTRIIKVLVADDHTMVRDGICAVLELQKDISIVGEAVNGQDAFEKASRLLPHVTLMDIVMPVMNGLEATRIITRECPQTKVLILTQYDEEENIRVARDAGASGFIPKRGASSELVTGIRAVSSGKYYPSTFATTGS